METQSKNERITMLEVAEKAGVSKSTVSNVLNGKAGVSEETRQRILDVCDELDYHINTNIQDFIRGTISGETKNIAYVLVGLEFGDPESSTIIDGVAEGTALNNYHLLFAKLSGQEKSIFDLPPILRDRRVDGILISGSLDAQIMGLVKELEIPCVILGNYPNSVTHGSFAVEIDTCASIHKAVREFASLGKKKIAFFTETLAYYSDNQRLYALRDALGENGLEYNKDIIYIGQGPLSGAFHQLEPIFETDELPFDAILCLDFRTANEISHLAWGHHVRTGLAPVLLGTGRPYAYYKLPIPAIYMDGLLRQVAQSGVEFLLSNITRWGEIGSSKLLVGP